MSADTEHRERLKLEAARLKENEILRAAFEAARREALEALAVADATDLTGVLRLQAKVAAIDAVWSGIDRIIIAAPREKRAVI
jgi:hypothetical protein